MRLSRRFTTSFPDRRASAIGTVCVRSFCPMRRLTAVHKKSDGSFSATSVTVEGYIERAGKYFREKPFYESELLRRVEKFGQEAHVFSTYESREAPDAKPLRGESTVSAFQRRQALVLREHFLG